MPESKFETLFREELQMLYNAEKQVVEALPKLIAATSAQPLAAALQEQRDETLEHLAGLERIFREMGEEPAAGVNEAMQALIQEGETLIGRMDRSPVLDAGLIGTSQKIENYQICGYETVRGLAAVLGQQEAAEFFEEALEGKTTGSEALIDLAEAILSGEDLDAMAEELDIDEEFEEDPLIEDEEIPEDSADGERKKRSAS